MSFGCLQLMVIEKLVCGGLTLSLMLTLVLNIPPCQIKTLVEFKYFYSVLGSTGVVLLLLRLRVGSKVWVGGYRPEYTLSS